MKRPQFEPEDWVMMLLVAFFPLVGIAMVVDMAVNGGCQ